MRRNKFRLSKRARRYGDVRRANDEVDTAAGGAAAAAVVTAGGAAAAAVVTDPTLLTAAGDAEVAVLAPLNSSRSGQYMKTLSQ